MSRLIALQRCDGPSPSQTGDGYLPPFSNVIGRLSSAIRVEAANCDSGRCLLPAAKAAGGQMLGLLEFLSWALLPTVKDALFTFLRRNCATLRFKGLWDRQGSSMHELTVAIQTPIAIL